MLSENNWKAVTEKDKFGYTPLHLAAKYNSPKLTTLLISRGGSLSDKNKAGETVLEVISKTFYDASNYFELLLDNYVCSFEEFSENVRIFIKYAVLTDGKEMSQISVLEEFVTHGHSKLLMHPLLRSLLYLKWTNFFPLFYILITFNAIFFISIHCFVVSFFYYKDMYKATTNSIMNSTTNDTDDISRLVVPVQHELPVSLFWPSIVLLYGSILILLLLEAFFAYARRRRYFCTLETWVKLGAFLLCAYAPWRINQFEVEEETDAWQRHVACAALLLAWLQAMMLISRIPHWGYYVPMFGKVATNILKILGMAVFLVIDFTLCFMIQFHSVSPFDGYFTAFAKTFVMMSSEFDYEALFNDEHDNQLDHSRTVVRLLFIFFVIFVAIALMNFMTGVAVSDVHELIKNADINRLVKQVELLKTFDTFVNEGVLAELFKSRFGYVRNIVFLTTFTASLDTNWSVSCQSTPDAPLEGDISYEVKIRSKTLYNNIVDLARKNTSTLRKNKDVMKNKEEQTRENDKNPMLVSLHEQIKCLVDENTEMKHSIVELNKKIDLLTSNVSACIKLMTTNKGQVKE